MSTSPKALDIEAGGSGAAARPAKPPSRPSPRAGATTTGGGSGGGGEDVRKTVRQSLGFPGALELVLLLSITSVIFSIACCSANSSGWFISKTGGKDDGLRSTTNVGWARYKSDINDIWHASPKTIDEWSEGAEAMGSLSFIGHLVSIFLFLAIVTYLYAVLAYGRAVKLGRHATQARFLALALLGLGTWLFCFSLVGFPAAAVKDFQDSTDYVDKLRPDWAWGLSFLVTLFSFFVGGILMRASQKIDDSLAAAAGQS